MWREGCTRIWKPARARRCDVSRVLDTSAEERRAQAASSAEERRVALLPKSAGSWTHCLPKPQLLAPGAEGNLHIPFHSSTTVARLCHIPFHSSTFKPMPTERSSRRSSTAREKSYSGPKIDFLAKTSANTRLIIAESFTRIFRAGPLVSFNGSPTVSPVTAFLCAAEPFGCSGPSPPFSMYFLALSHAPPVLLMEIASWTPLTRQPDRRPATQCLPNKIPAENWRSVVVARETSS